MRGPNRRVELFICATPLRAIGVSCLFRQLNHSAKRTTAPRGRNVNAMATRTDVAMPTRHKDFDAAKSVPAPNPPNHQSGDPPALQPCHPLEARPFDSRDRRQVPGGHEHVCR